MAELRSFIFIDRLQPQTMSYLGSWIKGALPRAAQAAQIIEVAPGIDIEGVTDVALKHADVDAGILFVERQFGYLEFHGESGSVQAAATACLEMLDVPADSASRPKILSSRIISSVEDRHAFLMNRNKLGSSVIAGDSVYVLEVEPASYAILATNEAEKAADIRVVDYRMVGATGRVYLAGTEADVRQAADAALAALEAF